jgi:predicted Zn-dependent protease
VRLWLSLTAALLAACVVSTGCTRNPATGRLQFSLISEEQEIALGKEAHTEVIESVPLYEESEAVSELVEEVGDKLAANSERPGLPWTFTVLDDPSVNAFALPGGFLYVTRGLLAHLNSEDELAAVLGHETGHVTARHSAVQMRKARTAQRTVGFFRIIDPGLRHIGGLAASMAGLSLLKYSRDDETEADDLSIRYVQRTGYDPAAIPEVFDLLASVDTSAGKVPTWLSTHPDPQARRDRVAGIIGKSGLDVADPEYLAVIEGIVYGVDPRNGFMYGSRYLHPRAGFQIDLPPKWTAEHGPNALVALADDENAVIILGPTTYASPAEGMAAFFEGDVAKGEEWVGQIGGFDVITAAFSIPTDSGALGGLIAFVDYDRGVIAMVAAAPQAAWAGRADAVATSFASFRRISDADMAKVEPMRIALATLPSDMTLTEFDRVQPSVVHITELARLNHVAVDEPLQKGRVVKRVTGFNPATRQP